MSKLRSIYEKYSKEDENLYKEIEINIPHVLRIKKISQNISGGKILDVGCKRGHLFDFLKRVHYYGLDISKNRIKYAKKKNLNVVLNDVNDGFPFKKNIFDYIVLAEIIEHIPNPLYLLEESYRVLKKGGKVILTTPNNRSFLNLVASFFNYQQHSLDVHLFTFSKYELRNILKIGGFKIEKMETFYFRPVPKLRINFEPLLKIFPQLGETLFCVAKKV